MEEILKQMIEQLQSLEWGEAQENIDGAIAYLSCAWQNLRNPTTGAVDLLPASACCASYVFDGTHHKDCRYAQPANH